MDWENSAIKLALIISITSMLLAVALNQIPAPGTGWGPTLVFGDLNMGNPFTDTKTVSTITATYTDANAASTLSPTNPQSTPLQWLSSTILGGLQIGVFILTSISAWWILINVIATAFGVPLLAWPIYIIVGTVQFIGLILFGQKMVFYLKSLWPF